MRIKWFSLVRITGLVLVLLYHYFQNIFPGGFIGVDVFFTFSGFLITALLIDEFARTDKIDLIGYFRRRFYRIVPPLVFMILITMPFTFLVRRDYIASIGSQILASLGFVTNIYEVLSGGSYESQFIPHLFVHTWSLAIEVHYYILWGVGVWYLSRKSKKVGALRGSIFMLSAGLFLLSFLSMFIGAFTTKNFSDIYFSTFTHIFPFFLGSILATLTGVKSTGALVGKLTKAWTLQKTITLFGASLLGLVLLGLLLKFNHISTYLIGFLASSFLTVVMILATRILHEKTEKVKEPQIISFLADTSYGVYLFHWPFYIIFGQVMPNLLASVVTTVFSLIFASLSFYILEPILAGREPVLWGTKVDLSTYIRPLSWLLLPLVLTTLLISITAPTVGDFERSLTVEALNQADSKMQQTRANVDKATATDYNVSDGESVIGDSVALRASDYLREVLPDIQVDASVSRNLDTGIEVYKTAVSNHILLKNVIVALGTNPVDDFKEKLDEIVEQLPKGHRLIFVTPYDGRVANDANSVSVRTRQYELELAEKYDFIYIADWYQTALENPAIWVGTDNVHFGSEENETVKQGGELYANTVKSAVEEANKGAVKP